MALHPKGFDLSLDRISRLLDRLGNPQEQLPPVIHIAGTNGKGSAAAFSRALLEAAGYRVHVHTSPHLVNWHERYRLAAPGGGRFVDDAAAGRDDRPRRRRPMSGETITVFEILTAVTFLLFSEHPADAAIIEVGLGGRFDATNVIRSPAVSLIMPISLDHEAYLGDRVELIAAEKAGIIKRGCPVVIGAQETEAAQDVLVETAERLGCPLTVYGQDFLAYEENGRMVYQDEDGLMDLPPPRLPGRHQFANAAAAIAAVKAAGFEIGHARRRARHGEGRLAGPHAAPAAGQAGRSGARRRRSLARRRPQSGRRRWSSPKRWSSRRRRRRPLFLICGMINTKDQSGYFRAFEGMARHVYTVPVEPERGRRAERRTGDPRQRGRPFGRAGQFGRQRADAAARHLGRDETPPRILIGGSLYLVGAVLAENGTPPT